MENVNVHTAAEQCLDCGCVASDENFACHDIAGETLADTQWGVTLTREEYERIAAPAVVAVPVIVVAPPVPLPKPIRKAILQADGVYRLGDCPKCVAASPHGTGACGPCRMEMADGRIPDAIAAG